jgi:hypothetical protein
MAPFVAGASAIQGGAPPTADLLLPVPGDLTAPAAYGLGDGGALPARSVVGMGRERLILDGQPWVLVPVGSGGDGFYRAVIETAGRLAPWYQHPGLTRLAGLDVRGLRMWVADEFMRLYTAGDITERLAAKGRIAGFVHGQRARWANGTSGQPGLYNTCWPVLQFR